MTKQNQIYICKICGNIIEILHVGVGELVCCGQAMKLMTEKTQDENQEKPADATSFDKSSEVRKALADGHLPVIEKLPDNVCRGGDGIIVRVGEIAHPMEEKHYIEWVEVKTKTGKIGKQFLKPGDSTEMEFQTRDDIVEVRVYCNLHGLWVKKID